MIVKKMKIENEKQKINNKHQEKMKGMEYNYLLQDKTIQQKQEIDLLKQKSTEKKQDEELRIKSEDHYSKNERDLKEFERKISVNMPKDKGEIELTMERINFEAILKMMSMKIKWI